MLSPPLRCHQIDAEVLGFQIWQVLMERGRNPNKCLRLKRVGNFKGR